MINVNIWKYRGSKTAWGHASLQIGQTYISWWPQPASQEQRRGLIFTAHPIKNRSYIADVLSEGQYPDYIIGLDSLDEEAIKDWWKLFGLMKDGVEYSGPLLPYNSLNLNCSTVVAKALSVGGGNKYANWWDERSLFWTPADVLDYALSIRRGLRGL